MIYNSLGVLTNRTEIWMNTFDKVKKYMDDNNKRPSTEDKNEDIKSCGHWLSIQRRNYIKKIGMVNNEDIQKLWLNFINDDKYKKYFVSNIQIWLNNLNDIKNHIIKNGKPSKHDKNEEIKRRGCN